MAEETIQKTVGEVPQAGAGAGLAPASLRAILGQKLAMTQIFDEHGFVVPITLLRAGPCLVSKVCTKEKEGYGAVQLSFSLSVKGRSKSWLKEFRLADVSGFQPGQSVALGGIFKPGDYVDVTGVSKGKGFAGGVKRHGFRGGPATHGQSDRHRAPGSLTSRRSLGRVLPGQRMAGRMGGEKVTVQKLEVVQVLADENLIYVKGAVPGVSRGGIVVQETSRPSKHKVVHAPKVSKRKKAAAAAAKK